MINPPYSQKGVGLSEFDFIKCLLDFLKPSGIGIAIVPMRCAIDINNLLKETILESHTLLAVMSLPTELFVGVGVVPCIMVFEAHKPHYQEIRDSKGTILKEPRQSTWFGYWKDDGFVKVRNQGRIDKNKKWEEIEEYWINAYRDKKEIPGFSALKKVSASDEWCVEAYMETDYSQITKESFEEELKKYLIFQLANDDRTFKAIFSPNKEDNNKEEKRND